MIKQTIMATALIAFSVNAEPAKKIDMKKAFTSIEDLNSATTDVGAQIAYEGLRAADRDLYDMGVYKAYKADPADGIHAPIAQRIYFKMTAPQYFKVHNLDWKNTSASYWK